MKKSRRRPGVRTISRKEGQVQVRGRRKGKVLFQELINHAVCQDITTFTDDTIKQIAEEHGEIDFVNLSLAMLCEDFSMVREMAPRNATDLKRLISGLARPGMMGEKGKLLLLGLLHQLRIKKVFPKVKFLFENVIFTDLPDFQVVELVLEIVWQCL